MEEDKQEENKEEDKKEEQPAEPESADMISMANVAAKRIEDATAAMKIENDRLERSAIKQTLAGKAEAGIPNAKPKEETPADYVKKVMANDI